ncbi:MAG: hypothetical protein QOJ51_2274, partial [Acidobacteriaceae bacterium]|nr:hypothetical protein [Acidobacteriaceae bacterium]
MNSPKRAGPRRLSVDPGFFEDLQWWVETQPRVATRIL